jgi:NAD(P)-dependent dehydrogenase (short-subunit alcohol dehydrogenase family)
MRKNILLIGGSYGIGLEVVKQLSTKYDIYVASRTVGDLDGIDAKHIQFDVLRDDISKISIPDELHGFAFCPGSITLKPLKMMDIDNFREDMEINFFSMVKVVKGIMSKMTENSSMVFFSTVAVGTGMSFHTSVAAAKGAIEGFALSLAAEYAPRVRVNVIAPSLVDTPLAGRLLNNDKKKTMMAERHPLKRVGVAKDIAHTTAFLLDSDNSWITGQVFAVDGGMSRLNTNP